MRFRILVVVMTATLLVACRNVPVQVEARAQAVEVAAHTVTASMVDWPVTYQATGTVRARNTIVVSSRITGEVNFVGARAGDRVRLGQTLVTLDMRDLEAACRRAKATRTEARSAQQESENAIAAARSNLDLAQVTFRRMKGLAESKSISDQEFDEAAARLRGAQANLEMSAAKRAQIVARIEQTDEEVRLAEIMCSYARITAPVAGIATARSVEAGNLAVPGAPLFTIEKEGSYRFEAAVEESRRVRVGQPVSVELDALQRTFAAQVSDVVEAVDASSRSYLVKIDLPAADGVRSGQFGRAVFSQGTRSVLALPVGAVAERGQVQSVMVVEGGIARIRMVTVGRRWQNRVEALSGLRAGEKIIYPLPPDLTDGVKVGAGR